MKKFYFLLICTFLVGNTFSQSFRIPTVREIFDVAVGDTFEYRVMPNNYYRLDIITTRTPYHDSVAYTKISYYTFSTGGTISNVTLLNIDSAFYRKGTSDTIKYSIQNGDTVYQTTTWSSAQCFDSNHNTYITETVVRSSGFMIGLGKTGSSENIPCTGHSGSVQLIYAHRANGVIYGTPVYSVFTGFDDVEVQNSISVFPTSSFSNFQIQVTEPLHQQIYFTLYDALGRQAKQEMLLSATTTLNRENLNSGIYFWQAEAAGKILGRGKLFLQ